MISDHPFARDRTGMRHYKCCDCGIERPDYMVYERRGKIYCQDHFLDTADKRAYERWFVAPQS